MNIKIGEVVGIREGKCRGISGTSVGVDYHENTVDIRTDPHTVITTSMSNISQSLEVALTYFDDGGYYVGEGTYFTVEVNKPSIITEIRCMRAEGELPIKSIDGTACTENEDSNKLKFRSLKDAVIFVKIGDFNPFIII